MESLGLDGFCQGVEAAEAEAEYIPSFDLSGVPKKANEKIPLLPMMAGREFCLLEGICYFMGSWISVSQSSGEDLFQMPSR